MEETIFPGASAVFGDDPSELEEERRLCYVGITRAMKKLTLTSANQRMRNGEMNFNRPSRFINEIPRHLVKQTYGAVLKVNQLNFRGQKLLFIPRTAKIHLPITLTSKREWEVLHLPVLRIIRLATGYHTRNLGRALSDPSQN